MFPGDGFFFFFLNVKKFQLWGHLKAARISPEDAGVLLFLEFAVTWD